MMQYHDHDIRVRYAETDQMGVCYYGNYLTWFEVGRTEYFRTIGLVYTSFEKKGVYLPVGDVYCRYFKPLQYDDMITIRTWVSQLKRTSIRFSYTVYRKDEDVIVAEGYTTHVFTDKDMKAIRIPEEIRKAVSVTQTPASS